MVNMVYFDGSFRELLTEHFELLFCIPHRMILYVDFPLMFFNRKADLLVFDQGKSTWSAD